MAARFGLFQWEKIIFGQNAYFCLKMIFRPCYFYFLDVIASLDWGYESDYVRMIKANNR